MKLQGRSFNLDAVKEKFWREFATGLTETRYDVVAFGDNPAMETDLVELVVARTKRATAGLVQQFGHGKEPPPVVGGYFIVVDGNHQPRAICQTTDIEIGPLSPVSESFAVRDGIGFDGAMNIPSGRLLKSRARMVLRIVSGRSRRSSPSIASTSNA
jgi:uncharacterized protein YhfF